MYNLMFVLCSNQAADAGNGFWFNLAIEIVGAILFLIFYEKIYKNAYVYFKNEKFIGRYTHCDMNFGEIVTNGNQHYSEINIDFWNPSVLNVIGFDYTIGTGGTWRAQIKIDPDTGLHGFGAYKYDNQTKYGVHDVVVIDDETLSFQLSFSIYKSRPYLMVKSNSVKINRNN